MPDVHAGAGCTIGTTMTITNSIVPNLVELTLMWMETIQIRNSILNYRTDKLIYEKIPSGFNIRDKAHKFNDEIDLNILNVK